MKKNKEKAIIISLIVLLVVLTVGISYAAFSYSGLGSKVNTITTGAISMTYEETENVISLDKALPTTDKTGKTLDDYFEFTVSGNITGDTNINYEISVKAEPNNTFDGDNVKLYLTRVTASGEEEVMVPEIYNEESSYNNFTGRPSGEMSLYTSSMSASESNTYRLRMYVTEEYNPQGDGGNLTFSVKVNVYGKDGEPMPITTGPVSNVLLANISKENQYDDGVDTFITGEDPNNYIWYSGKLWRAVSVNNEEKTVKLVTEWNISAIPYNPSNQTNFAGSYMESWLNDTTVDGFLGNLREPEKFIVTDSKWDATMDDRELGSIERPNGTNVSTSTVGLLNVYEYQSSNNGGIYGYLNNGITWWTLTPHNSFSGVRNVFYDGYADNSSSSDASGVRPSINLKSSIKIVDGNGTENNPYRLEGDNDANLEGTMLNTRYSGEYIRFGTDENNLYRIVSHENKTETKITSAKPLKDSGTFKTVSFGDNTTFSSTNTIGAFLNGEYLTSYVGEEYSNMIEESTTWYLGTVGKGDSYKLAKYTDEAGNTLTSSTTTAKVGLLRSGELMSGQFDRYGNNTTYWDLTPFDTSNVRSVHYNGHMNYDTPTNANGVRPSLNLKSNVQITSGTGTKSDPFVLILGS